jgi:hypothetical protein
MLYMTHGRIVIIRRLTTILRGESLQLNSLEEGETAHYDARLGPIFWGPNWDVWVRTKDGKALFHDVVRFPVLFFLFWGCTGDVRDKGDLGSGRPLTQIK